MTPAPPPLRLYLDEDAGGRVTYPAGFSLFGGRAVSASAIALATVRIANPCDVPWDAMTGDERVRFCERCRLNVYNLSAMTRQEAEDFLQRREGRTCLRLFRRSDGTVLTRDCPVGLRAARGKVARAARLLFAGSLLALLAVMAALWWTEQGTTSLGPQPDRWASLRGREPFRSVLNWLDPPPPPPTPGNGCWDTGW